MRRRTLVTESRSSGIPPISGISRSLGSRSCEIPEDGTERGKSNTLQQGLTLDADADFSKIGFYSVGFFLECCRPPGGDARSPRPKLGGTNRIRDLRIKPAHKQRIACVASVIPKEALSSTVPTEGSASRGKCVSRSRFPSRRSVTRSRPAVGRTDLPFDSVAKYAPSARRTGQAQGDNIVLDPLPIVILSDLHCSDLWESKDELRTLNHISKSPCPFCFSSFFSPRLPVIQVRKYTFLSTSPIVIPLGGWCLPASANMD